MRLRADLRRPSRLRRACALMSGSKTIHHPRLRRAPACILSTFRPPKRPFWAPKSPYLQAGVHYLNLSTSKTVILSSEIAVFASRRALSQLFDLQNGHFELRNRRICKPACIISTFRPPKRPFWAPKSPYLQAGVHYINFSTSKTVILSSEIAVFASRRALSQLFDLQNGHFELRNRRICKPACIISTFRSPKRQFWAPKSPYLLAGLHYLNFSTSKMVILSSEIAVFASRRALSQLFDLQNGHFELRNRRICKPACIISTFRPPKRPFWAPKSPYLQAGVHYINFSTSKTVILSSEIAVFASRRALSQLFDLQNGYFELRNRRICKPACIISTFRSPKRQFWAPKSPYLLAGLHYLNFRPPKWSFWAPKSPYLLAGVHYLNFSTSKMVILTPKIHFEFLHQKNIFFQNVFPWIMFNIQ